MATETWALVMDWIGNDYADIVVRAVQDDCRSRGHSLMVYTIGTLSHLLTDGPLADQVLPVFKLQRIDRLIIGSSQLQRDGGGGRLSRLLRQTPPRPVVSLGGNFDGLPAVHSDQTAAFRHLLSHLWDDHGYRRFAWVGGPAGNPVAETRRDTMLSFLAERGGCLDPALDIPGDFNLSAGREAGYRLGGVGGFDVVVAANDAMALGVREILGPSVPVTGMDNSAGARVAGLTTVDLELGRELAGALELLASARLGAWSDPVELQLRLGRPVIRASCGCAAAGVSATEEQRHTGSSAERVGALFEGIIDSRDMTELSDRLSRILPLENIRYWRFLPPVEPGDGQRTLLDVFPDPPPGRRTEPQELVVHSLYREKDLFGYFVHDLSNRKYELSEWLRINLCLALQSWQRTSANMQVQRLLKSEIDRHDRRQREVEAVLDSLPVWIVELDRRLSTRYANSSFIGLVGPGLGPRDQLPFLSLVDPADRPHAELRLCAALKEGAGMNADFRLRRPDGRLVPVMAEIRPVDAGSSLSAMNGSLHGGGLRLAGLDLGNLVGGIVQPEELLIRRHDFGPREREAVRLLARGLDTAGIARAMGVTENTARVQLHRVYVKTGVSKRKEFLELLAEYHARTSEPHSLTRVLLARLLGRN